MYNFLETSPVRERLIGRNSWNSDEIAHREKKVKM